MNTKKGLFISLVMIIGLLFAALPLGSVEAQATVSVVNLAPSWTAPGGGGVYSAYIGPPAYGYVSPGVTTLYEGRDAGIIKAGLAVDPTSGNYEDEGLFGFKPTITIDDFASSTLAYDVITQEGTNPVWMTIEIDTGVVGDRGDNTTYQHVPTTNPAGWHNVDAGAGLWQMWNNNAGDVTGNPLISLSAVASAHTGLDVVRAYLRLGMGNSYNGSGNGTIAWVDFATVGGVTYDFEVNHEWYVATTGNDANFGIETDPFLTIQHAIDVALAGDTIHVAAGDYIVSTTILVNKGVTITGPVGGGAKLISMGTTASTLSVLKISASDVSIQGLEITHGALPAFGTFTWVELDWSLIQIPINPGLTGIKILDNKIYVPVQSGLMSTWSGVALTIGSGTTTDIEIAGNTIYNTRNGIVVHYNNGTNVHDNVIYNTKGGIMNYTGTQADADNRVMTDNTWTSAHNEWDMVWNSGGGPYDMDMQKSVLQMSQANNEAYVLSLMSTLPAPITGNRSHVFVDITTGTTTLHGANGNINKPYAKIQDGIDAVVPGGKVYVAAGTYGENVVINKSLELIGAGIGNTIIMPAISNPNPCTGSSMCGGLASNVILVEADDVIIHDLTVDGDNPALTSGIVKMGADLDARNGIIKNTNSTYNDLEVYNTFVKNIYLRGIYSTNGSFNFHHNEVTNVQGDAYSIAMFAWGGPGIMANNTVSYANDAISANHSKGIQFLDNTITNSGSGIHTDNSNDGGGVADLIQGNTISDCTPGGYGIWSFVPYAAPVFDSNTVSNCAVGISAWGQGATVVAQFTNNTVTGPVDPTGSVGAYITTDLIGWGYSDIAANFVDNVITGFEAGVQLTADQQSWNSYPFVEKTIDVTFRTNQIYGNTTSLIVGTAGTYDGDLIHNWWGSIGGPITSTITSSVDFTPWCGDPDCTFFVPDENGIIELSGNINVPGGIVINQPNLTFLLKDGAIIENDSPCFIVNASYTTITTESIGGAMCIPTDGANGIDVAADLVNITIEGLEFVGTTGTDGIHFAGAISDVVIVDNWFHNFAGDGIEFTVQPTGTVDIQGNLFQANGGLGINASTFTVGAEYNAWGHYTAPVVDTDISANVDANPWTHVDLTIESSGTPWTNQVVNGEEITYTIKGSVVNAVGADFELTYPSSLLTIVGTPTLGTHFTIPADGTVIDASTEGVISFAGRSSSAETFADDTLFTVTFTAIASGTGVMGFDETSDSFAMFPGTGPSLNIYATALLDGIVKVIDLPTISSTDIQGPYIAGLIQEFHVQLQNPSTGGSFSNVLVNFTIEDTLLADVYSFEYFDGVIWHTLPLTQSGPDLVGSFGPSLGFPMSAPYDATSLFRIVNATPGSYDVHLEVVDLTTEPDYVLATFDATSVVLGNFTITGTVSMQGRTNRAGVPMRLTKDGLPVYGPFNATSINVISNNLTFTLVNGGTYTITTNMPRYLDVTAELAKTIDVVGNRSIAALELKGGDANDDNAVELGDASLVGGQYGTVGSTGDVNYSGFVDIFDLAMIGGNYGLTSASAYASWLVP